jgi:hypothetical protein
MEKIDRLGWADGISIYAYGRRVGVRTNVPAVLENVCELLPPGWEACASPLVDHLFSLRVGGVATEPRRRNYHLLYGGFTRHARSLNLSEVLDALESYMHVYLAEYAANRIFVHAGVVGWHGQAILLPGASGAGKSTIVAALLRAGATYLSDEYAVLDHRGYVHPFARPLSMRSPDGKSSRRCSAAEFGSCVAKEALPVGMVVITQYLPEARWRPRPLTGGQAILALMQDTLSAQLDPEGAFRVLEKTVNRARIFKGPRGVAEETAVQLLSTLDGAAQTPGRCRHSLQPRWCRRITDVPSSSA